MSKDTYKEFVKKSESLVKPVDSTAISFLGDFNKYLPKKVQRSIMEKGSRKIPYMGFIVDPYCFFLSYPIKDRAAAEKLLPDGYELADTAVFKGDKKVPSVIISSFAVRTSVFTGMRVECYVIARNKKTGRTAWIITDYETNTTSHDPKNGFCGYTCDPALFATTPYGELLVEAHNINNANKFSLRADISGGTVRELDEELWIEGNLDIDYGGRLKDAASSPFSLIFDPFLMKEAREIPLEKFSIGINTLMKEIIDGEHPSCAALFPYTQHFIIRQDLNGQELTNSKDLLDQVAFFMKREGFKTMKGDDIKKPLFKSMMISSVINVLVIATLFILLLLK